MSRAFARALLGLAALFVLAVPAAAQTSQSVTWSRFDADLSVQSDGSVRVQETQQLQFSGTFHQGNRTIPTDRTTGITDVSVAEVVNGQPTPYTRGNGQPGTFNTTQTQQGLRVDWTFPTTTNGTRTFVLSYTAQGAIRVYSGSDQLDWNAIYADRQGPVQGGTVVVHLPGDVAPSDLKTALYEPKASGSIGALPQVGTGTVVDARTVQFAIGSLPPGVGAEVRVQFPATLVSASAPPWQAAADRADQIQQSVAPIGNFLALLLTLGILAGGAAWLLLGWYSHGRDPAIGTVPPRLDRPPSDLPAPLAGALVDERADERDAVAAITDLASRGVLTLSDEENPKLQPPRDIRLELRQSPDEPQLRPYERTLLTMLFGPRAKAGDSVTFSQVGLRFNSIIPLLQSEISKGLETEGLFERDPEATRRRYRAIGWVLAGVGVALAVGAAIVVGGVVGLAFLPGFALAIVGVVLAVWVARIMPRRTQAGALEAARWKAFRVGLREPAAHQLALGQYLPYAVAFGIDRTFLQRLEHVGAPPPAWYGPGRNGGVVVMPGGYWGPGPWIGIPPHGGGGAGPQPAPNVGAGGGWSAPSSPQGWSDALADLLNAASEALSQGGGSGGWGGGGFGGGGGGGGGSGGFS